MDTTPNPLTEFEEIRISVPWGHLDGRWYGEKKVRPILALHGWLDNYGTWDTLIPLMPPHIGVLVVDMPGHGKSTRLPPGYMYHVLDFVSTIIRVMREYNWDKVSIMAHSMSSINSFLFAALYPDKVDMLIQIDIIHPRIRPAHQYTDYMHNLIENFLLEEDRLSKLKLNEPPSYSYEELIERMYEGTNRSLDKDKCESILRTNVTKSNLYPSKYYFSRDPRAKHYIEYFGPLENSISLAKRIKIPHLAIKGSRSYYINVDDPVIQVLRDSNPFFEFHVLDGTHHVHLNNPQETSGVINSFINKWRPPPPPAEEIKPRPQSWVQRRQNWKLAQAKL